VGGPDEAYERLGPVLEPVADVVDGRACCAHVGSGPSGHFAALAHEAGTVVGAALVAEHDLLLRSWGGDQATASGDEDTGAGSLELSGTRAQWALQAAARLGAPVTGLAEALLARRAGAVAGQPEAAAALGAGTVSAPGSGPAVEDLAAATDAGGWVAWAQAFDLVRGAGDAYGWDVDLAAVATAWRGGRRVRPTPLGRAEEAYDAAPGLVTLLAAPSVADEVSSRLAGWRRVVAAAVNAGVPAPVTTALLGYVDGVLRGTG
jgi:6-phosphogluconate dehydrogenase